MNLEEKIFYNVASAKKLNWEPYWFRNMTRIMKSEPKQQFSELIQKKYRLTFLKPVLSEKNGPNFPKHLQTVF